MDNSSGSELMNSDCGQRGMQLKASCISWTHFWLQLALWMFFFFPQKHLGRKCISPHRTWAWPMLCTFLVWATHPFFSPGWPQGHYVAEGDLDHWILLRLLSKCWDYGARHQHHMVYMVLGKDQGLVLVRQGHCPLGYIPCISLVSWTCIWHIEIFFFL